MDDVFENNGKLYLPHFSPDALVVLSESVRHAVATRSDNIRTPPPFHGPFKFP
jgi:hypothetical protein